MGNLDLLATGKELKRCGRTMTLIGGPDAMRRRSAGAIVLAVALLAACRQGLPGVTTEHPGFPVAPVHRSWSARSQLKIPAAMEA